MTIKQFRKKLDDYFCQTFYYKGKKGMIEDCIEKDPVTGKIRPAINIAYDNEGMTLHSLDEALNAKIFDGKSLTEIVGEIELAVF